MGTLRKTRVCPAVSLTHLPAIIGAPAGEKVSIVGFGNFERAIRAARTGRNPATGESLEIPEKATPTFKPGKVFKDTVKAAYTP
jgi:nucleoid DNA-binding protein